MNSSNEMLTGGDILVKCLLEEKVQYLFGIIGGELMAMFDAVYRWGREEGINTVMFRHEQAAAHAADAWARVTNTPGVCFGTVGPGALHLVPAVGAAWSDNIPMIVIVPQKDKMIDDSFALQGNVDQIGIFKPITKYQRTVRNIERISDAVHKAFREATGGRPRPVILELTTDATFASIEEDKVKHQIRIPSSYRAEHYPAPPDEAVTKALKLLKSAEKPVIISGGGVMRSEAWIELQEFAEYLKIPVITSIMGIGTIPNTSKCYAMGEAGSQADVVLALGCKFSHTMGLGKPPRWNDSQKLIQVDIDPSIIGRAKPVSLGIISDCKNFLSAILKKAKRGNSVESREWLETCSKRTNEIKKMFLKMGQDDNKPISPHRLVSDAYEFADDDAIYIADGGNITGAAFMQMTCHKPRPPLSTLCAIGMGHLGTSVPYGIGVKLAKPDKQAIAICGDGSFMMNIQDLETAVRLGLNNLIYIVANNSAWGMLKSAQQASMESRFIDVDLPTHLDYSKMAESMGCYGESISEPKDITPALKRAKKSGLPAVLDVKTRFQ